MKQNKKKKCNWCSREYIQYKPLFPYCSFKCFDDHKKEKNKGKIVKPPTKIKRVSKKRKIQNDEYSEARAEFLQRPENKFCPVMSKMHGKTVLCTDVHHIHGRENERLLDQEFWIAVSREGHQWIHSNPELSREAGWLI